MGRRNRYEEYDEYEDEDSHDRRAIVPAGENDLARRAVDWGISGSIIAIIILTAIYAFSPIDAIPDILPVAGQADDVAAIAAGGGSVVFLTIMRFIMHAAMRNRWARIGCLIVIFFAAIGAFVVFWALLQAFQEIL
jgi:hypothetical protein